jgi:O-antigen/teichoic acid export membrane protein
MSAKVSNIAKNTSYFTIALIIQKIISFSFFIILARTLGPEDLGKYYFAISFTTIFAIIIDLGFANVLTREVAKKQDSAQVLFSNVLAMKIPLAIFAYLCTALLINVLHYPELTRQLVYLSSICMVLDSFTLSFFSIIRAYHNLSYESLSSVIFQLIVLVTGVIILKIGGSLTLLMNSLVIASIFNFCFSLLLLNRKFKIKIKPVFSSQVIKNILSISIVFTLFAVFQRVYTYLDTVMISMLAGDREVGLYQVAFKIIFAIQFLPSAFIASLYPALSCYWLNNRSQLGITFERSMNYLIIISLPISVGTISIASQIINLFKTGYNEAILPLQITIAAVLFIFINFPIGALLNACDYQKKNTINMALTATASILLNFALIPRFGAVGASITVLLTNILMFALGFYYVPRIINHPVKRIFYTFCKAAASALAMGAVIALCKSALNIVILIALAGLIYFACLYVLRAFTKEDLKSIVDSFGRTRT